MRSTLPWYIYTPPNQKSKNTVLNQHKEHYYAPSQNHPTQNYSFGQSNLHLNKENIKPIKYSSQHQHEYYHPEHISTGYVVSTNISSKEGWIEAVQAKFQEEQKHIPKPEPPKSCQVLNINGNKCYVATKIPPSEKPTKETEETTELVTKPSPSKKQKFEEPAEKQINYKGAHYNFDKIITKGTVETFRCKYNRGKERKCNARLKRCVESKVIIKESGNHHENCFLHVDLNVKPASEKTVNAKKEIRELVDQLSVDNLTWNPRKIYKHVKEYFDKKYKSWYGLTDIQICNRVHNVRREMCFGDSIYQTIEQPHIGMMDDSNDWFLQINYTLADRKTHKLNRLTVFGNPHLFGLMYGSVYLHVDATFHCCPKGYDQMLVIMIFDEWTQTYVDVLYILMTSKTFLKIKLFFKNVPNIA